MLPSHMSNLVKKALYFPSFPITEFIFDQPNVSGIVASILPILSFEGLPVTVEQNFFVIFVWSHEFAKHDLKKKERSTTNFPPSLPQKVDTKSRHREKATQGTTI